MSNLHDDLRKFRGLPPYNSAANPCMGDGYFYASIEAKHTPEQIAAANAALDAEHCTKTVRYDLSPAMVEGEIRDKLIELGWTPPGQFQPDWANYRQGLADGWDEGYAQGIKDERISEANIGIAGFGAKVNPARVNPYGTQQSAEPVTLETVYETIIKWDEGGGKRSRRELARRIVALYAAPTQQPTPDAYNRRLQRQLEQEWSEVKKLREAEQAASTQQSAEPVAFLANGTRFKMAFFENDDGPGTHVTCFGAFEKELDGRWVALVAAEDDCHLKLTQPATTQQAVELTDEQIAATAGRMGLFSQSRPLGQQWENIYRLVRRVIAERLTAPTQQSDEEVYCFTDVQSGYTVYSLDPEHKETKFGFWSRKTYPLE